MNSPYANPYEPTPPSLAAKALDELHARPSLEDTTIQVQTAMDEITAAASKVIPSATWETLDEGSRGNCQRPYEQTDGKRYFLPDMIADRVPVSEADWATIVQAAKESAAKLGATDIQVMQDQPGNHDMRF